LWGNYRKSQGQSNTKILFIDSEGTSSIDRSTKTYDSKIFALVVLISSLFIYNTTANIDEQGISELSLAAHLSNSIACNSSIDKETLISSLAPKFIWALRDFTLEKVHPETGEEISNNEYLEICLRKKISGKNSQENNLIRENIVKYFKERECVTLPRPVESEEDLKNLKNLKLEKLKPNFKFEFINLKNKIYKEAKPKKINGKKLTGAALADLILEFVNSINNGAVPNINNAWDHVISQDIKNYYEKALLNFKNKIKNINTQQGKTKLSFLEIIDLIEKYKFESHFIYNQVQILNPEVFNTETINENYLSLYEEYKNKLEKEILELEDRFMREEKDTYKKNNSQQLKKEYKEVVNLMFKNHYSTSKNNMRELGNDFVKIFKNYDEKYEGPATDANKSLCCFINENLKEILYYLVTNTKSEYKIKINELEKKSLLNMDEIKNMEHTESKLKEINNVFENRVRGGKI
jgi:hypothetical protein